MSESLIEHYMKNGGRITRCPYKVPLGSEFSWHGAHPQDLLMAWCTPSRS